MVWPQPLFFMNNRSFTGKTALVRYGATVLPELPILRFYGQDDSSVRGTSRRPLVLSREEEVQRFLEYNYAKKRHNQALLSKDRKGLKEWGARVKHLEEYLIRVNLPLVYSQIGRTRGRFPNLDHHSAVSEGSLGLVRAVQGVDISLGFKFATYACRVILRALSRANSLQARRALRFPLTPLHNGLGSDEPTVVEVSSNEEAVQELRRVLKQNTASLTQEEHFVVQRRFGLGKQERQTLAEIGLLVGLTRERVRQIQNQALAKLREKLTD